LGTPVRLASVLVLDCHIGDRPDRKHRFSDTPNARRRLPAAPPASHALQNRYTGHFSEIICAIGILIPTTAKRWRRWGVPQVPHCPNRDNRAHLHRGSASDTILRNEVALESSCVAKVFLTRFANDMPSRGRGECPLQSAVTFGITSESGKRQREAQGFGACCRTNVVKATANSGRRCGPRGH